MKCQSVDVKLSEYLDECLPQEHSLELAAHLRACGACYGRLQQMQQMRITLRTVASHQIPEEVKVSLRVVASRVQAKNARRNTWAGWWREYRTAFQLWANNLMRPIAIPLAGGLCAALLLFGILVPNFTTHYPIGADVPTGLYTGASLKNTMSYGFSNEVVLDVEIDDQGRMVDYTVTSGQRWMEDPAIRRMIENNLLFATFIPATTFGQPMSGKVRISFRPRISFDIKG